MTSLKNVITAAAPLILASASPRRQELLSYAGIPIEICPTSIDETVAPQESAAHMVHRLALGKCEPLKARYPHRWILGADTTVVVDEEILGKPLDRVDARKMLEKLSGRNHMVLTAFAIQPPQNLDSISAPVVEVVSTKVLFTKLLPQDIELYLDSGESFDKAGGYAFQGKGAAFIERIEGSHTNVIGLPLSNVIAALRRLGAWFN